MKLLNNNTGLKADYETELEVKEEGDNLVFSFASSHPSLSSYSNIYNDDIWSGDVVEIFISTNNHDKYLELEVAPNNTKFLALITNDGKSFKGEFINDCFFESTSIVENDVWKVEIKLPKSKVYISENNEIKFNAFRIDTDGEEPNKHLFALSPTMLPSFHKLYAFIKYKI